MVAFPEDRRREIDAVVRGGVVPEWLWSIQRNNGGWTVRYLAASGRRASRTFADATDKRPDRPDLAAEVALYDALRFRAEVNAPPAAPSRR